MATMSAQAVPGPSRASYSGSLPPGASYPSPPATHLGSSSSSPRPPLPSPPSAPQPTRELSTGSIPQQQQARPTSFIQSSPPYEGLPTFVPAPAFSRDDRGPYPPHRNSVLLTGAVGNTSAPAGTQQSGGLPPADDDPQLVGLNGLAGVGVRNSASMRPRTSPPAVAAPLSSPPPHLVQQPEICVECMMRDRDMIDVDVTSPGVWDRDSDVDLDEWNSMPSNGGNASSEESGVSRGNGGGGGRRGGKGMMLTTAALKTWTALNPPASAHRWRTLQTFLAQQQHYLSLERAARQTSTSSIQYISPPPISPAPLNPPRNRSSSYLVPEPVQRERHPLEELDPQRPTPPWLSNEPTSPRRQSTSDLRASSPSRASFTTPSIREEERRSSFGWGRFRRSQGGASLYSFGAGSGSMLDMHLGLSQDLHSQMRGMGNHGKAATSSGVPYATYASLTRSEPFIAGAGSPVEEDPSHEPRKKKKGIKALFSKLIGRPPSSSSKSKRREHDCSADADASASMYNYPYPSARHTYYQNSDEALAPPPPITALGSGLLPRGDYSHSRGFSRSTTSFEPSVRSMPLPGRRRVSDDSGASPPRPGSYYFASGTGARSPAPSFLNMERDEEVLGLSNAMPMPSPGYAGSFRSVKKEKSLPKLPPDASSMEGDSRRERPDDQKTVKGRKSKVFSKIWGSGDAAAWSGRGSSDRERIGVRY